MMHYHLALGGNMPETLSAFQRALESFKLNEIELLAISSLYQSKAWGIEEQADFYNMVVKIASPKEPEELLQYLLGLEKKLGRNRDESIKWGPRLIDLDILLNENRTSDSNSLQIPHKYILDREFVYIPLLEISPSVEIPGKGKLCNLVGNEHLMTKKDFEFEV